MPAMLGVPVIYEDRQIMVLNKPAGLVVNKAETAKEGTLQEMLEASLGIGGEEVSGTIGVRGGSGEIRDDWESRAGIVHRLDKDTSGVLIVAKTPEAFENLQSQFKARAVQKEYLALVHGVPPTPSGVISAPISRNPRNRFKYAVVAGGREAETEFEVIREFEGLGSRGEKFSLLRLKPKTGRTHQLRVHLTAMNCPVVSDVIYGGRKRARSDLTWCPRLFLHAKSLNVLHPVTKRRITLTAELPEDLTRVLDGFIAA